MSDYDFDVVQVGDEFHYQGDDEGEELVAMVKEVRWMQSQVKMLVEGEFGDEFEIEMPLDDIGGDDYTVELIGWHG